MRSRSLEPSRALPRLRRHRPSPSRRTERRLWRGAAWDLLYADIFRLEKAYAQLFRHVFTPILDRFQVPEDEREYLVTFYLHGLMAVISQWLRRDCPEDVETLSAFLSRHVPQGQ